MNNYAVGDILTYSGADVVYVYGLFDPMFPNLIRYVGQTRFPTQRLMNHAQRKSTCGSIVLSWFEAMHTEGRTPSMVILATAKRISKNGNVTEERHWMRKLITEGHPILNSDEAIKRWKGEVIQRSPETGRRISRQYYIHKAREQQLVALPFEEAANV